MCVCVYVCVCMCVRVLKIPACAFICGTLNKISTRSRLFFLGGGWLVDTRHWTLTVLIAKKQLFILKLIFKPVPVRPFLRVLHTHNMEKLMQESAPLKIFVIF